MNDKKVAVITGAGQGIGLAAAYKFAEEGWAIALIDLNKDTVEKETKILQEQGADAAFYILDVSDFEKGREVVQQIRQRFGRIDALFNNAGITGHRLMFYIAIHRKLNGQQM